ncbi:MAG: TVP38/TMEM64 family protein [Acidobacteria bacterium]|nr:TVP38/TMEM64 family protein [Acidobacteriota bacterium]
MSRAFPVQWLGAAVVIAGASPALAFLPLKQWLPAILRWIGSFGGAGAAVYAALYVVGTVLFVPGVALTAGAGLIYGPVAGSLLVSAASVTAATISFLIARHVARDWVESKLSAYPKALTLDRALKKNGFKVVLLLRLEPVILPFALLNYSLGLTRVTLRDYVLGSWLGMLPATLVYVYLGSAAHSIADLLEGGIPGGGRPGRILYWGGLCASILLILLLGRIARRALQEELDAPSTASGGTG